jgi:hypothetical protein
MDIGKRERRALSIPSFASERCRSMTAELMRALEGIPPTDDKALEDRALACFVVACGELASLSNTAQRDTVVEQLTVVARKLVNNTLATRDQDVTQGDRDVNQGPPEDRQSELASHVGMTWEELEAVLKKEKAAREAGR